MMARKMDKSIIRFMQISRENELSAQAKKDLKAHRRMRRLERGDNIDFTPREIKFWIGFLVVGLVAIFLKFMGAL